MFDNSSSHRLVGKFFTTSTPPSFVETENSLRQQWLLSHDMMIVDKQGDTFLFEFRQEYDKKKVLGNRPYNVNGVILVIKDPTTSNMIDFTVASFNVVVEGLPSYHHHHYTENLIRSLNSLVGTENNPVSVLLEGQGKGLMYLGVEVDLKKPLRPGFFIEANRFVEFKYINLGDFCYKCGIIGHVETNCHTVRFHKERALNATSRTHVYGPWLDASSFRKNDNTIYLQKSPQKQNECDKTLSYAQFFVELDFNNVFECNTRCDLETLSTHRFRFPCSYLDTDTNSTTTTSRAYDVIVREILENTPFSHVYVNWNAMKEGVLKQLKCIRKNDFSCDDKWLTVKLQFNNITKLTPVEYETRLAVDGDRKCDGLIESKILDLIKKRVGKNEDLISLPYWENQIRQVLSEMGVSTRYTHEVSRLANLSREQAVQMELSSSSCPKPADKSRVSELKRFKVLGPDMDKLDPCVICVNEMFLREEATVLPCSHVFHSSCIEKWLQVGHKCPLCGFKLLS